MSLKYGLGYHEVVWSVMYDVSIWDMTVGCGEQPLIGMVYYIDEHGLLSKRY